MTHMCNADYTLFQGSMAHFVGFYCTFGYLSGACVHCRLHIVPQPVDVDFFNPAEVTPLPLPVGELVLGQPRTASKHIAFLSVGASPQPTLARVFQCCCWDQNPSAFVVCLCSNVIELSWLPSLLLCSTLSSRLNSS